MGGWFSDTVSWVKDAVYTPTADTVKAVLPTAADLKTTTQAATTAAVQAQIAKALGVPAQTQAGQPAGSQTGIPATGQSQGQPISTSPTANWIRENPALLLGIAATLTVVLLKKRRR
jgi:hypothetical protein